MIQASEGRDVNIPYTYFKEKSYEELVCELRKFSHEAKTKKCIWVRQ